MFNKNEDLLLKWLCCIVLNYVRFKRFILSINPKNFFNSSSPHYERKNFPRGTSIEALSPHVSLNFQSRWTNFPRVFQLMLKYILEKIIHFTITCGFKWKRGTLEVEEWICKSTSLILQSISMDCLKMKQMRFSSNVCHSQKHHNSVFCGALEHEHLQFLTKFKWKC